MLAVLLSAVRLTKKNTPTLLLSMLSKHLVKLLIYACSLPDHDRLFVRACTAAASVVAGNVPRKICQGLGEINGQLTVELPRTFSLACGLHRRVQEGDGPETGPYNYSFYGIVIVRV